MYLALEWCAPTLRKAQFCEANPTSKTCWTIRSLPTGHEPLKIMKMWIWWTSCGTLVEMENSLNSKCICCTGSISWSKPLHLGALLPELCPAPIKCVVRHLIHLNTSIKLPRNGRHCLPKKVISYWIFLFQFSVVFFWCFLCVFFVVVD